MKVGALRILRPLVGLRALPDNDKDGHFLTWDRLYPRGLLSKIGGEGWEKEG